MFPAINLLRNSFPNNKVIQENIGKRITGHFMSHITARLPKEYFLNTKTTKSLQIGAVYLDGKVDVGRGQMREYHIQITAITSPNPQIDAVDAARECPDYAAAANPEQLEGSENYVLIVCATLGEISENGNTTWCKPNLSSSDPTTNSIVQVIPSSEDMILWNQMNLITYDCIEVMAGNQITSLQYWNEQGTESTKWINQRPLVAKIPGIVHEASGCFMENENSKNESVVNTDFRPHGVSNVYLTGASIFPTSGSWNPTLTMCGFAQVLAKTLIDELQE